jgi:signal transduction histidine kinase
MHPDFIPHFGVGLFFGLASSSLMAILCFVTMVIYPRYRPLRSLLLFYLLLSFCFLGWVIYGLQKSPESIFWGYRIDHAAISLLPASWLWFYLALLDQKVRVSTWVVTGVSIVLAALALFGNGPLLFGLPMEPDPVSMNILRPQSKLLRPLIHYFSLIMCLTYFYLTMQGFWRNRKQRALYLLPVSIGLLLFFLGGLHDALRSRGLISREPIFWLASFWLSIFFVIAITLHFRNLERALGEAQYARIEALEHSRKELERLNRAKSIALDHLSHELRTPLAVIQGNIRLLKRRAQAQTSPVAREEVFDSLERNLDRISNIQHETNVIIRSYQELEATSSPETMDKKETPPVEPISLYPFTERILNKVKQNAAHRDLRIQLDGTYGLSLNIDSEVLEDTLIGLLKNSIENTPDEGLVRVVLEQKGRWIELKVQDFGIGITPENQRYLFDGLFHTQSADLYTSKKPYDFGAGGKGLDLLKIKVYGQRLGFDISVATQRCLFLSKDQDLCPGRISLCPYCKKTQDCDSSGGSTFCVSFPISRNNKRT